MNLKIERRWPRDGYTIGVLLIDGYRFCETLEDTVRMAKKVKGETAIPAGTYRVRMDTVSPKFKERVWACPYGGIVPRLEAVPGFEGVLIHPGNTAADTDGCILVGNNRERGKVLDSQLCYRQLMDDHLIPATRAGEDITIEIV